jgi:hypothetical protein
MSIRTEIAAIRAEHPTLPAAQIARHLGISREYVRLILIELGLPTSFRTREPGGELKQAGEGRLQAAIKRFDNVCQYCGTTCVRGSPNIGLQPSVDRIIPHTKGGKYQDGNELLVCRSCNSMKCNRSLEYVRHRITLKALRWPSMSREAIPWLKEQGFDVSAYEAFRFPFEQ